MRTLQQIARDKKRVKQELIRLEAKYDSLLAEETAILDEYYKDLNNAA